MRRQSSAGSHRLRRGRQRGSGCLGLSCHLLHSSSAQAQGSFLGWECVPQGRGVFLNAAASENGVEHRGGALAGRSVGEMVGNRTGLGGEVVPTGVQGDKEQPLTPGLIALLREQWPQDRSKLGTQSSLKFSQLRRELRGSWAPEQQRRWPHPAMHRLLQAGLVLENCASCPCP